MTSRRGRHLSAAGRRAMSARMAGKKHPHKGRPMSAASRAKLSAALKGKAHKGHPMSAASRAKLSAALKGRSHAGHPMSAATRAKLSASLKGRHRAGRPGGHRATGRGLRPTGVRRTNPLASHHQHKHRALVRHKRVRKRHALAQLVHHHKSYRRRSHQARSTSRRRH